MRTASKRFVAALGKTTRFVTRVQWTNDGTNWFDANLVSGSVTRSLSDDLHWTASLELVGTDGGLNGVNAFNTRVKLHHGIMFGPGQIEVLPFGVYRVTETDYDPEAKTLSVSLESYESFVIQAKYTKPENLLDGSAQSVLDNVLGGVFGSDYSVTWDDDMQAKSTTAIPGTSGVEERWPVIDGDTNSVADAIGGRIHTDENGGWRVRRVPTLQDEPVLAVDRGSLLIEHSQNDSVEDVVNIIVASGTSVDGVSIGPAVVRDEDPNSATRVTRSIAEGGFGEAPLALSSSRILTEMQCMEFAQAKLAERLGIKQSISWSGLHNPLLEPGDVVTIEGNRVIADAVTYDLNGGPLSAETRTQSTDLLGSVWEYKTEDEDETDDEGGEE